MGLLKYRKILNQCMFIIDLFVIYGSCRLVLLFKDSNEETKTFMVLFWFSLPLWGIFLKSLGMYRDYWKKSFYESIWLTFKSSVLTFLFLAGVCFLIPMPFLNKNLISEYMSVAFFALLIVKSLLSFMNYYLRSSGGHQRNILLVGTGPRAENFMNTIVLKHPEWGINVIGLIDEDSQRVNQKFFGITCIGTLNDVSRILDEKSIQEVVIVVPRMWLTRIQETITTCELRGVKVSVAGDLFELKISQPGQKEEMDGFPLLTFASKVDHDWELFIKRTIDIVATASGIIVLSLPLIVIAIFVKLTSPGPVFFKQKRVGLHGRLFSMHKFRTMYTDAKERFEAVKHLNEVDGPVFKIKNDPRITPLGKFLRKTSLDELPQLFDVLVGNMSLVGPRPGLASELEKFEPWMMRRLTMRPGITCLWQISGRNNIDFKTWMELDLKYIDNWSLLYDLEILLKTIPSVIKAEGAS